MGWNVYFCSINFLFILFEDLNQCLTVNITEI